MYQRSACGAEEREMRGKVCRFLYHIVMGRNKRQCSFKSVLVVGGEHMLDLAAGSNLKLGSAVEGV